MLEDDLESRLMIKSYFLDLEAESLAVMESNLKLELISQHRNLNRNLSENLKTWYQHVMETYNETKNRCKINLLIRIKVFSAAES